MDTIESVVLLTESEYESIEPDNNTLYVIVNSDGELLVEFRGCRTSCVYYVDLNDSHLVLDGSFLIFVDKSYTPYKRLSICYKQDGNIIQIANFTLESASRSLSAGTVINVDSHQYRVVGINSIGNMNTEDLEALRGYIPQEGLDCCLRWGSI